MELFCRITKVDQQTYIEDLNALGFDVLIVKVASLGLDKKHVGQRLSGLTEHLIQLNQRFGVHPAGEGGEFESFVLDCPMFKKRIVVEEMEKVLHSDDFSAPVYFLKLHRLRLEEKCAAAGSWVEAPRLEKETGKQKGKH